MKNEYTVVGGGSSDDLHNNKNDSITMTHLEVTVAVLAPNLKRKERNSTKNQVWNHFDKIVENGMNGERCRYCHQIDTYTYINGTTALNQHLARCSIYKSIFEITSQYKINSTSDARAPL